MDLLPMRIRQEQIEALKTVALRSFEQRLMSHLREFFPDESRRIGEQRLLATIRRGMARAGKYGLVSEYDVARYIDLSVVLGPDFDSGERYPWAKEILNRDDLDGEFKLEALLGETRRLLRS
jgi:hypothetical protein